MILIVNLNPAVDRLLGFGRIVPGTVHRSRPVELRAGGKGVNVARTLKRLETSAEVLLFSGGWTGKLLSDLLESEGLRFQGVPTERETRCCHVAHDESTGEETVWNEPGEPVPRRAWDELLDRFDERLSAADLVVLSGSAPPCPPLDIFAALTRRARAAGRRVLVDIPPGNLATVLAERPFLVKPNRHECEAFLKTSPESVSERIEAARELCRRGARVAVVTHGGDGAVFADAEQSEIVNAPEIPPGERIYATGAGDATAAGIAAALARGANVIEAVRFGVECGTTHARFGFQSLVIGQADQRGTIPNKNQ